jgi:hypothetical protein
MSVFHFHKKEFWNGNASITKVCHAVCEKNVKLTEQQKKGCSKRAALLIIYVLIVYYLRA